MRASAVLYEDQLPTEGMDDYDIALIEMQNNPDKNATISGERNI